MIRTCAGNKNKSKQEKNREGGFGPPAQTNNVGLLKTTTNNNLQLENNIFATSRVSINDDTNKSIQRINGEWR